MAADQERPRELASLSSLIDGAASRRQSERRSSSTGDLSGLSVEPTSEEVFYETVITDPISESYKSLVSLINKASNEFNEGKKWKCNHYCNRYGNMTKKPDPYPRSWKDFERVMFAPPAKKDRRRKLTTHSRTTDESQSTLGRSGSGKNKTRNQLVRQMATEDHGSRETLDGISDITSAHIIHQKKSFHPQQTRVLPRQWTTDGCPITSPTEAGPKRTITAGSVFLLRPVSKTSVMSGQCPDLSNFFPVDRPPSPAKRAAIAAAVAAAGGPPCRFPKSASHNRTAAVFSTRTHSAGEVNQPPPGTARYALHVHRLQKQQTSESAPTPREGALSRADGGLPRQHSTNSAYSAGVYSAGYVGHNHPQNSALFSSFSHQGLTLIRGASCSLVDIPTYLGPTVRGDPTQISDISPGYNSLVGNPLSPESDLKPTPRPRPRLQLDLTQRKNNKASTRKTKWTILCVGLTLLMMSVTMVGTMLSIGSQYQQMMISKQWETLTHNKTYGTTTTTPSPYIFLSEDVTDPVMINSDSEKSDEWNHFSPQLNENEFNDLSGNKSRIEEWISDNSIKAEKMASLSDKPDIEKLWWWPS